MLISEKNSSCLGEHITVVCCCLTLVFHESSIKSSYLRTEHHDPRHVMAMCLTTECNFLRKLSVQSISFTAMFISCEEIAAYRLGEKVM